MVCNLCKNLPQGKYRHCTCYLNGAHGINPDNGSMSANDWFNRCNLSSPPTDSDCYLLATRGHVVLRNGDYYYYHGGDEGSGTPPRPPKQHSPQWKPDWCGLDGEVRYLKL